MTNSIRNRWSSRFAVGVVATTIACGGGGGDTAPPASIPSAISLDQSSLTLTCIGVTAALQATVTDSKGQTLANAAPTWSSSNASVVTVAGSGNAASLTSVGPGSATITARAGSASAVATVSVAADIRSLSVNQTTLTLTVDDQPTAQLTATSSGDPGVTVTYSWTSSNAQVATVTATGATATVTAVAVGSAVITATGRTSFGTTKTADVTVSAVRAVRSVTLSPRTVDIGLGKSLQLTATVTGEASFPRTVTWSSSNEAVATVSASGLVAAVSPGSARIRAIATGDATIRDSVAATVTPLPISLSDFVLIPAGSFTMGSSVYPAFGPEHTVTLTKSFYLQKTEVTQAQWEAMWGTNPSLFKQCGGNCPVETVTFEQVQTFISLLNSLSPGVTYRLPTEAEWEYAARATTTGERYGNLTDIAWYVGNSSGKTHPVAGKQPNLWGLYDMIGNVAEMVQDLFGPYPATAVVDPVGPATGAHIVRGAHFLWGAGNTIPSATIRVTAGGSEFEGFRLVRVP